MVRTSSGSPDLAEMAADLKHASVGLASPVLLVDGLDESAYPGRIASAIEQLSLELDKWKFVVSARSETARQTRHLRRFGTVELRGLTDPDAASLLRTHVPSLPAEIIDGIIEFTHGNPLLLQIMHRNILRSASPVAGAQAASTLEGALEWLVNAAVTASSDPAGAGLLLEEIALAGGRDTVTGLAAKCQLAEDQIRHLLDAPRARALVVFDETTGSAELLHGSLRQVIVSRRILRTGFRLDDLRFGAEEAERDELLDVSYVQRPGTEAILAQNHTIVVGDRGAGKSALFRKLAEAATTDGGSSSIISCPVPNGGYLLHKIVTDEASWLDTDALRAAWLVIIASALARALPASAARGLRLDAAAIRAALDLPMAPVGAATQAVRAVGRILGGTTLTLAVGPAELQVQLPSGVRKKPGRASVDVSAFIHDASHLLDQNSRRAVVLFDRVDEVFKYDRARQQAIVQALLQAEAEVSLLAGVRLIVFLRTDLFELYDIQEKNKLVSRTLTLNWAEEEWLQVLVRRIFANKPLQGLPWRIRNPSTDAEVRSALEVLFPAEIEGEPVDRWLIDSLRNGNGNISPRLAILLLYLARDRAARPDAVVSSLPLFSATEAGKAMTRLSELSFSEVVSDFKVAPTFVQNCRVGKLATFALADVRDLFDPAEGKVSDQVRLLERLGFLERIVREHDGTSRSLFQIPRLYSRCFDYA